MKEDPRTLIAEANIVVSNCEAYLDSTCDLVLSIPARREKVLERLAAANEVLQQAKEANRACYDISRKVYQIKQELESDDLDPENRKAVARQLASLIHVDAEQKLRSIARRSDEQELQRIVSESREDVARATRYVLRRFAKARPLLSNEVRQVRCEASKIFDHLRYQPADE